jgi:alkane 1-monooxygenase
MPTPWRYLLIYLIPAVAVAGLLLGSGWTLAAPILVFGIIPLLELALGVASGNAEPAREESLLADRAYDLVVYGALPVQFGVVTLLLVQASSGRLAGAELVGAAFSVGLCCGGVAINIGHELGHRKRKVEQRMAQALLLTSLYVHFFIEHNRGHHSRVSTDEDPASARRGELVYTFWFRSVVGGWLSAWRLEAKRLRARKRAVFGPGNQMLWFQLIQVAFVAALWLAFGPTATLAFVGAAVVGILLLETVNYLEHYGLRRERTERGTWERIRPEHSWNSSHLLGRALLFELSRHSDHHAHPRRKYQVLRHFPEAPQLPTGYPGMIVLSLVPPLFFAVVHRRLETWRTAPAS